MASTSRKNSRAKSRSTSRASKARRVRKPTRHPKAKPSRRRGPHRLKATVKKAARPAPRRPVRPATPRKGSTAVQEAPASPPRPGDSRHHVLSLSFLRDGDEFLARIETDAGQITEFKHRVLDQLLSLVASELEDLLE